MAIDIDALAEMPQPPNTDEMEDELLSALEATEPLPAAPVEISHDRAPTRASPASPAERPAPHQPRVVACYPSRRTPYQYLYSPTTSIRRCRTSTITRTGWSTPGQSCRWITCLEALVGATTCAGDLAHGRAAGTVAIRTEIYRPKPRLTPFVTHTVDELRNEIRLAVGRFERQESTAFTKETLAAICAALDYDIETNR